MIKVIIIAVLLLMAYGAWKICAIAGYCDDIDEKQRRERELAEIHDTNQH